MKRIFTLDDHLVDSGQGKMVAAACARLGLTATVTNLGLTDIPCCGRNDEVLARHGLDAPGLAASVAKAL